MAPRIGEEILYLSRDDVAAVGITAAEMNDAMTAIFRAKAENRAWTQPKLTVFRPDGASFRAKVGVVSQPDYGAIKWFGYFPGNERAGFPDFAPLILLNEGATGMPVALMDGIVISAQRTGSLTAVAARYLARRDAASVAFIACGTQARSNLEALLAEFPLQRVVAYSRRVATAEAFAAEAEGRGLSATVATDPHQAMRDVDIVVSSVPHASPQNRFLDATASRPAPSSRWSISATAGTRRRSARSTASSPTTSRRAAPAARRSSTMAAPTPARSPISSPARSPDA